jgi:hypothetical protein
MSRHSAMTLSGVTSEHGHVEGLEELWQVNTRCEAGAVVNHLHEQQQRLRCIARLSRRRPVWTKLGAVLLAQRPSNGDVTVPTCLRHDDSTDHQRMSSVQVGQLATPSKLRTTYTLACSTETAGLSIGEKKRVCC